MTYVRSCPGRPLSALSPYTTLFRSRVRVGGEPAGGPSLPLALGGADPREHPEHLAHRLRRVTRVRQVAQAQVVRSEEHTSELQSQSNLVCRLLIEIKTTPCSNKSFQ